MVPKLHLIVGWNPKVACTTVKYLLLTKLGHKIEGNIHLDMLTSENLKNGKYGIYSVTNSELKNINRKDYLFVCVVRNPYERLISGIRQRSSFFVEFYPHIAENTISEFIVNLKKMDYIEHHFIPQSVDTANIEFDHVIPLQNIKIFYDILEIPFVDQHIGGHETKYSNKIENYHGLKIEHFIKQKKWSKNIFSWFSNEDIKLIDELYEDDFLFFKKYNITYK